MTFKKVAILPFLLLMALNISAQNKGVTISGIVKNKANKTALSFVNILLKTEKDSAFVTGTVTNEEGRFSLQNIKKGSYYLELSFIGFNTQKQALFVGSLTEFLDVTTIEMTENSTTLGEVLVTGKQDEVGGKMDKKTFSVADNISQNGGSVLQAMQNLPSVTVQDGKVQLRGNDRVSVLIDGK
jgi:osmotically-inducible protein OsmY